MKNLIRIFSFFSFMKWRIIAVLVVGSLSIIMFAFMPMFLSGTFDTLREWMGQVGVPMPMHSVIQYLIIFLILAVFNALFDIFCTFTILRCENKIMVEKITEVKRKLDTVPISFLQKFTVGDLSRRVANLTGQIINNFLVTFYTIVRVVVFFVTSAIMMFMINWILAIIVILSIPLCVIAARLISRKTQKYFYDFVNVSGVTFTHVDQKFSLKEFHTLHGLEDGTNDKFHKINTDHAKSLTAEETALSFNTVYIHFIQNFMNLLVTFVFGVLYVTQLIPTEFGALPAFVLFSNRFLANAVVVTTATNLLQIIVANAPKVFEILDYETNITEKEHIEIPNIKSSIAFANVSYLSGDKKLLDRISFNIPQGSSVAFVGPVGSGKAYVVDLLAKLEKPSSGTITIDGISLDEIESRSYYKCLGISFEQPFIFRGTVAENLLYGIRRELPENVMYVTEKLGSHSFIEELENGYETFLTDSTSIIGPGQKQALCVARLVLQNPDVAIFHQSLSATDTVTEKQICEKIMELKKKQTKIFVTHRLSSAEKCDIIFYMENGKIVESGSHKDLMALKKRYYKAFSGE